MTKSCFTTYEIIWLENLIKVFLQNECYGKVKMKISRIQYKRAKGSKQPKKSTYPITRSTKLENLFKRSVFGVEGSIELFRKCIDNPLYVYDVDELTLAEQDRYYLHFKAAQDEIKRLTTPAFINKRKKLVIACWCNVNEPCHGDIIIEKINEQLKNNQ